MKHYIFEIHIESISFNIPYQNDSYLNKYFNEVNSVGISHLANKDKYFGFIRQNPFKALYFTTSWLNSLKISESVDEEFFLVEMKVHLNDLSK